MNYYAARQLESGPHAGKWHYTCMNDGAVWAYGACSSMKPCPACNADGKGLGKPFDPNPPACSTCDGKRWVKKTDEERCWHETAEEAYEHERQRILDEGFEFRGGENTREQLNRCEAPGCKVHTDGVAFRIGNIGHFWLCKDHQNRETLDKLVTCGESWSSY
jgi:hypothetical protein